MSDRDSAVSVVVRVRPLVKRERARGDRTVISVVNPELTIGGSSTFTFDAVFDSNAKQETIYEDVVAKLVNGTFDGFNATILAYGQTGSGKTHTMGTGMDLLGTLAPEDLGIVPRAVQHIFQGINERKTAAREASTLEPQFEIGVQFVELYNETIYDLLTETKSQSKLIKIQEEPGKGEISLRGVQSAAVKSPEDMLEVLRRGALNRTVGSTNMNEQSSRSHAIFSIHIKQQRAVVVTNPEDGSVDGATQDFEFLSAKFHFVDLAGSERMARTGATGVRAREGININRGLLVLGNVITALAADTRRHVPYRDSKLTRLLQDSLGGNSRTLMIACASPSENDFVETLNTLNYANRAKNIKNKIVANQDKSSRLVAELRGRIVELEAEIMEFKSGKRILDANGEVVTSDQYIENTALMAQIGSLTTKVKALQEALNQSRERNIHIQQEAFKAASMANGGEEDEDSLASMANNYIAEMEVLRSELSEAHATVEDLSRQVLRLKAALSSRSPHPELQTNDSMNSSFIMNSSDTHNVLKRAKEEVEMLKRKALNFENRMVKKSFHNSDGERPVSATNSDDQAPGEDVVEDEEENSELSENSTQDSESSDDEECDDEDDDEELEEQDRLCSDLMVLHEDISIKEKLIMELENSENRVMMVRAEYEKKLQNLSDRINQTEAERNAVLEKLATNKGNISSREMDAKINQVKDEYERRLGKLQTEFKRFKAMEKNHNRMVEQTQKQQQNLTKYRQEIEAMKKNRVELLKKINKETKLTKDRERNQERQMGNLRKEARKRELRIQHLETRERQREDYLRRKDAEYDRKIKQLEMKKKIEAVKHAPKVISTTPKRLMSKSANPVFSPNRVRKSWQYLENGILKQASKRLMYENLGEELEGLTRDRQQLQREMSIMEKHFVNLKSVDERNALMEQLKSYEQKRDYIDIQIRDIQQQIIGSDETDGALNVPSEVELTTVIDNCRSMDEMKYIMKHLLQLTLDQSWLAAKAENSTKTLSNELEYYKKNYISPDDIVSNIITERDLKSSSPTENSVSGEDLVLRERNGEDRYAELTSKASSVSIASIAEATNTITCRTDSSYHDVEESFDSVNSMSGISDIIEFADRIGNGHTQTVYSMDATDMLLITGSRDRTARIFDLAASKTVLTLGDHWNTVRCVRFVPQSDLVVTSALFGIRLWDLRTGTCEKLFQSGGIVTEDYAMRERRSTYVPNSERTVEAITFDPSGDFMFTTYGGSVRAFDFRQSSPYSLLTGNDGYHINHQALAVQPSEDGSGKIQIISGLRRNTDTTPVDGQMQIFTLVPGQHAGHPVTINQPFSVVDVVPDGRTLFAAGSDGSIVRYSLFDYQREHILKKAHSSSLSRLAVINSCRSNGSLLVSGCKKSVVKFWDYEGRQGLLEKGSMTLAESKSQSRFIEFASNSKHLFIANGDSKILAYKIVYDAVDDC